MRNKFLFLSVICVLVTIVASKQQSDPESPPVWAAQFEESFEETLKYPILGSHTTSGKFYYDWTNKRYRVDRENGHYDRYCGSIYAFSDTPCSHIVVEGDRYLYFPEKNYCCYCCSADHGCGLLKPNWLDGAQFEGMVTEEGDETVYEKWNKPGLQNNFYLARASDRVMRKIDQVPNDIQTFDMASYYEGIRDENVFNLPDKCSKQFTCPFLSVCSALRN